MLKALGLSGVDLVPRAQLNAVWIALRPAATPAAAAAAPAASASSVAAAPAAAASLEATPIVQFADIRHFAPIGTLPPHTP
jgi:hypothetical protein